ncbi:hypothetical protein SLE2022_175800 [Rubroshorea leprosula]
MLQIGVPAVPDAMRGLRYEKLKHGDETTKVGRPRKRWVKKMKGGIRLSRSRKLIFKAFSMVVLAGRVARVYADIIDRMKMDGFCPNIIFSTQWGLPVLSHPSLKCRKTKFS